MSISGFVNLKRLISESLYMEELAYKFNVLDTRGAYFPAMSFNEKARFRLLLKNSIRKTRNEEDY
jgi:hypothetical protein